MSGVWLAVLVVGAGSLIFRVAPLLGAERLPARLTSAAAWAGLSVLTALTVRAVATHDDPGLPAGVPAPLLAAVAVGAGLWLAQRGRPVLVAVAAGAATYLVLAGALSGLPTFTTWIGVS